MNIERDFLKLLAHKAQETSGSKKTSDIFFNMLKIANDGKLYDEMLDLPNKRIRSILSEPGKYEYKKEDIRKELQNQLSIMSSYVFTKAKSEEIASAVMEYMPHRFIPTAVEQLEKYNGANANEFSLKGLLNGALGAATALVKQREAKEQQSGKQSLEAGAENFGQQSVDTGALEAFERIYEYGSEGGSENKEQALEAMFNKILDDPKSYILSLFVKNKLYPEFSELKQRLSGEISNEDYVKASADLDSFYKKTFDYIKNNYGSQKRIPGQRGQKQESSLREVQEVVDQQVEALGIDNVLDYIYKQNFYNLPKWARNVDENIVKKIFKSLIISELVLNAKESMNASLPGAEKRKQGGHGKLGQIEILTHVLERELRSLTQDKEEQEDLINQALRAIGSRIDIETGKAQHKSSGALQYSLYQHATPVMMAAYFQKAAEEYGEKFSDLSPEEQESIIEKVHSAIFKGGKLSHAYDTGAYELKTEPYHKLKDADEITKQHMRERLQKAIDIKSGKSSAGEFMKQTQQNPKIPKQALPPADLSKLNLPKPQEGESANIDPDSIDDLTDLDDDLYRGSALNYLIKKYALKR